MMRSLVLLLLFCATFALADRQTGGGGGALVRDGNVVSFESVKIPIHPIEQSALPGLAAALEGIEKLNVSMAIKGQFVRGVTPSPGRHFFSLKPSEVNPATYSKILSQYRKLQKAGVISARGKTTVAAITEGSDTYLLPPFFGLQDKIAQAALLLHEGLRVTNSDLSTESLVDIEMAFESYLRQENDVQIYYEVASRIYPPDDRPVVEAYFQHDLDHHALGNLFENGPAGPTLKLGALMGDQSALKMPFGATFGQENLGESYELNPDQEQWLSNLLALETRYPSSLVVRFLAQNLDSMNLLLSVSPDCLESRAPGLRDISDSVLPLKFGKKIYSGNFWQSSCDLVLAGVPTVPSSVSGGSACRVEIDLSTQCNSGGVDDALYKDVSQDMSSGFLLDPEKVNEIVTPQKAGAQWKR